MEPPLPPKEPRNRDWLSAAGHALLEHRSVAEPVVEPMTPPPGFPPSISLDTITFTDWSGYIEVEDVLVARISTADDVAAVCNWAAQNGYRVRPAGRCHNWSPLMLAPHTSPGPKVLLVDTTKLDDFEFQDGSAGPIATFGTGLTMEEVTAHLESVDNGGASPAPGYTFPHMPAPGGLTLGGVLAVGAHGTLVPSRTEELADYGCLSNLIVSFDAVVTDPDSDSPTSYRVQHFDRTDGDAAAFLVHLGRAFITKVALVVVPNYYLQLHPLFPPTAELFAPPSGELSSSAFSNLLDTYGRVEVLWFPFNEDCFVQCSQRQDTEIEPQVPGPYNYPWMYITPLENAAIRAAVFEWPKLTVALGHTEWILAGLGLEGKVLNGTARDIQIYLKDTTLKVTLFGWALQLPRADVQQAANEFFDQVRSMVNEARDRGDYPMNAAVEIRCTTLDRPDALPVANAVPPALSASRPVAPDDPSVDTMLWLNVGTMTGTASSNAFYTELESWVLQTWGGGDPNRLRPEWSKAWAYTADGPWTNAATLKTIRDCYEQSADAPYTFDWAASTLARYDAANLFTNPFLDELFGAS